MQKNWIGKSFGCEIDFKVEGNPEVKSISCFTTRPDTLFGFSFLAVSVDHPISKYMKIMKNLLILNLHVQKQAPQKSLLPKLKKLDLRQT